MPIPASHDLVFVAHQTRGRGAAHARPAELTNSTPRTRVPSECDASAPSAWLCLWLWLWGPPVVFLLRLVRSWHLLPREAGHCYSARPAAQTRLRRRAFALPRTLMSLTPGFQCVHPRTLMTKLPASVSSPQDTPPSIPMATTTLLLAALVIKKRVSGEGLGPT